MIQHFLQGFGLPLRCDVPRAEHDLVDQLILLLAQRKPEALTARFKIIPEEGMSGWDLLEAGARKRGFLISGGEVDLERMANILLDEFRAGKMGRITLELPEDLEREEDEHGTA